MRTLILGGTGEAAALARALAGRDVVTSLAGRTATLPDLPGRVRIGGFGGADGLREFLRVEGIGAVVDATHPFAARISAHAAKACAALGVPRLVLARPAWEKVPGDTWIEVDTMAEAAAGLPALGRRAFLTVGSQEAAAFAAVTGVHFVVRLVAPAPPPLAGCTVVTGRGPFSEAGETALLRAHRIDVVVSKASGGDATSPKIAAARGLAVPVLMIRRPPPPPGPAVSGIADAVAWVEGLSP